MHHKTNYRATFHPRLPSLRVKFPFVIAISHKWNSLGRTCTNMAAAFLFSTFSFSDWLMASITKKTCRRQRSPLNMLHFSTFLPPRTQIVWARSAFSGILERNCFRIRRAAAYTRSSAAKRTDGEATPQWALNLKALLHRRLNACQFLWLRIIMPIITVNVAREVA